MTDIAAPGERSAGAVASALWSYRWDAIRLLLFTVLTFVLAYGDPRKIATTIVGNPGDPFLIYSLLVWGGDRALHLFSGYSSGPMLASGSDTMAYSDTFLPLVIPFRLLETFSAPPIVAFNILYLASWILCCEFTYRLALNCCTSRPAAVVGAVAFSFTTLRLGQAGHFQLAWGALIPLGFLAVLRLRRRPTLMSGALVALVIVAQFLTSAYYGVILLVGLGALVVVFALVDWRRGTISRTAWSYASLALTTAALMVPVTLWYRAAEDSYVHRSGYPGYFRLRLGDLRSPAPTANLARSIGFFDTDPALSSSESFAYVGLFVIVFVPVFIVLLLIRRADLFSDRNQMWALGSVAVVGGVGAAIAVGRGPILSVPMPFYDVARVVIPGMGSMLAIVRLFVFMQLALVLSAVVALAWVLRLIPDRRFRVVMSGAVLVLVVLDSRLDLDRVEVPRVAEGSVYAAMQELDPGIAVQLPIPPLDVGARPYLEYTRMLLGSDDDLRIVNGHSGHMPVGFDETATLLNTFPSEAAIDELRRIGVKYVVLHSAPNETGMPVVTDFVNSSGYAFYQPTDLDAVLAALPPELIADRIDADDGIILVLR